MPQLKLNKTHVVYKRARVDVPEFGTDEEGEPVYAIVRNLTLAEKKQAMMRATWLDRDSRRIAFDALQVAYFGTVEGNETETGTGKRTFPSERFVGELPPDYEAAIVRLSNKILELSGMIKPSTDEAADASLDEAKKD